ncbi:hypothetical protein MNBD_ALPHA06-284 [hydrothermal vent metagenome]|uniref:Cytochrome c domain-containing protein n=1 Tax=hydrothermal vent metagenome TaxID=652676 RepID=A0A3B0RXR9_9ZZZZ
MKIFVTLLGGAAAIFVAQAAFAAEGDVKKGKDVYEGTCIYCHGDNGKGEIPGTPNFNKADGVLSKSDAELITNITDGFESPGADMPMPAKGGNPDLSDEDVKNVMAYLRKEFGTKK